MWIWNSNVPSPDAVTHLSCMVDLMLLWIIKSSSISSISTCDLDTGSESDFVISPTLSIEQGKEEKKKHRLMWWFCWSGNLCALTSFLDFLLQFKNLILAPAKNSLIQAIIVILYIAFFSDRKYIIHNIHFKKIEILSKLFGKETTKNKPNKTLMSVF